jgi:hypothetical protein
LELSREIYWNVGHGAMTLVPMYILLLIACPLMVKGFLTRTKFYRQGLPINRTETSAAA